MTTVPSTPATMSPNFLVRVSSMRRSDRLRSRSFRSFADSRAFPTRFSLPAELQIASRTTTMLCPPASETRRSKVKLDVQAYRRRDWTWHWSSEAKSPDHSRRTQCQMNQCCPE
jgi:hypothetical protein